jgi:hypothetical protein
LRGKRSPALRELGFKSGDVLEQTLRYELDEVKTELRILEIKLLDLIVTDLKKGACLDAFQALGASTLRREEGKLADHMWRHELDAALHEPEAPGNHDEHGVGRIPFLEENLPALRAA